jgi:hypothetical protein
MTSVSSSYCLIACAVSVDFGKISVTNPSDHPAGGNSNPPAARAFGSSVPMMISNGREPEC